MSGPFSKYASEYNDHRLSIIPCGDDDGKKALVAWSEYQHEHPPMSVFDYWVEKYADKNIGLITGYLNRITVVDCDDPSRSIESLEAEYGATPVIAQTPRGGKHLYYQHNGEASRNDFRPKIDIKANGGYVIGPYSISPKNGKSYSFVKGTFEDIRNLPISTHPSLPKPGSTYFGAICDNTSNEGTVIEGGRNAYLFQVTKDFAISVNTFEEVLAYAQLKNRETLSPPLSDREIMRTAKSVWKYKTEDRLWVSGENYISVSAAKYEILCKNPKALALYMLLLRYHRNNRTNFTIIHTGVAGILSCDHRAVSQSIGYLMEKGIIQRVHVSRGKNDGHQYRFC